MPEREPLVNPNRAIDPMTARFAPLHVSAAEQAALKSLEADPAAFARQLVLLERKYKLRGIERLDIDPACIQRDAFVVPRGGLGEPTAPRVRGSLSVLQQVLKDRLSACVTMVPFACTGLRVYGSLSGPEMNVVTRGLIGAARREPNEYTVWNPGDTDGTTREALHGQAHIVFQCVIPESGHWCLIHPSGSLWVRGHSRVVGHGNSSTCYDAKVFVDYYQVLEVGSTLLEIAGGPVHQDATRSEDRTKPFAADRELASHAVEFQAAAGDTLMLTLRLEIDAAANADGLAMGVIDTFGLPANTLGDYDSFVVKLA